MNKTQRKIIETAARHQDEPSGVGFPESDILDSINWAVLKYLETPEELGFDHTDLDVTVGYGRDRALHDDYGPDSKGVQTDWWDTIPPIEGTRFRIFYPDDVDGIPAPVETVMAAIGATPVGVFTDMMDSYDHRERVAAHYVLPDHAPIVYAVGRECS